MFAVHTPARALSPSEDAAHARAAQAQAYDVMESMVAAYALMAHADGEVAPAERRRFFAILRQHPALTVFSRADLANEVGEHEANFRLDPEVAQAIAREKLVLAKDAPRSARQIVQACRELIPADGVAHPAEYRALAEIKALLNLAGEPARPARPGPQAW